MDYFNQNPDQGRRPASSANQQDRLSAPRTPGGARRILGAPSYESMRMPSNIRIRRLPSSNFSPQIPQSASQEHVQTPSADDTELTGRRRSSSAPRSFGYGPNFTAADLARQSTLNESHMPPIREGQAASRGNSMHPGFPESLDGSRAYTPGINAEDMAARTPAPETFGPTGSAMHSAGNAAQRSRGFSLNRFRSNTSTTMHPNTRRNSTIASQDEYESDVIDLLDLVDPEVRTLGTLTNLQNSLFVPDLGGLVNRRPTYDLTRRPTEDAAVVARSRAGTRTSRGELMSPTRPASQTQTEHEPEQIELDGDIELQDNRMTRQISISSEVSDSHYAVLPHGVSLEGWADEDVAELNDHVRHLMHSKREGFKRSMRGFRQYVSKPLGAFVFIYATLVTLFGAAWVFGLIGWIYVGDGRQEYFINVVDLVLVALFALMGDGLAPFRAVDTYHMLFIAHYHHLTWKLREKKNLPDLVDHNDLPARRGDDPPDSDDIIDKEEMAEYSVLTVQQQKRLQYHQAKFNKSHTFYKPHETATHHAFPLKLLVAAVILLDCHSFLQIALGTCTWAIDYRVRPEALTATILSFSIACNIAAGVVISIGDHKTRKKDVLERIFRQGLTEQALKTMAKRHQRGKLGLAVDKSKLESGGKVANAAEAVTGTGPKTKKARKSEDARAQSVQV
ncbi:related to ahmp1 protein [Ramularia collo-cygni]|uniref:Related to ahmp1 protein n=1 Tax=Ramularia collo-cygni TaxID=112498 RepID=A0A2D3VFB7_9PEZI|nr:related to ahmp1 protein [Ramularia collo-cygni]CZT23822.1 related to ahmp1 protein [Ramularia collo-cygni]